MSRQKHPHSARSVTGLAEVSGTHLYYEVAGTGQPVVLIHGFTLDTRMWDQQFDVFARRYQVVRYDVRGFGRSAVPARKPYAHHDDLKALLDHLGIVHAHILGHSMGSGIAADFVLAYPEMADSLISVGAVVHGLEWLPEFREFFRSLFATAQASGVAAAKEQWLHGPVFAAAMAEPDVASRVAHIVNDYSGWRWLNDNPRDPLQPPASERLEEIQIPTLIVVGEREMPNVIQMADQLQARAPDVRRVTIPGAGHMPNMEDPVGFNRAVLGFLTSVSDTT
jgi:3-oxoadipate enol-lactonase